MRIAHVVSTYPPYYSGMGNVAFELASRLSMRGHTVEVFTPEYKRTGWGNEERDVFQKREDFARRLRAPIHYGNAAYLPELRRELDSFDIVHLHYPFFGTASLVSKWKKRNPEKALFLTYHMDTRGAGIKGLIFKLYAKWSMPGILASSDRLIASSFDYIEASDARDMYSQMKEKWVELPFGVDTDRFQLREKPIFLFERYKLDKERPTVIFVGGMDSAHYFKGVPVLLNALRICKNNGNEIQVVLVGDGNLRHEFELLAQGMGLGNVVRFVGSVSHEELPFHYAMADINILPSVTRGEAFGMVIIEGFASGIPAIASDLPGVRTVALEAGEVFQPNNPFELAECMENFFNNQPAEGEWARKARNVAERLFSWDVILDKLEDEYKKFIVVKE